MSLAKRMAKLRSDFGEDAKLFTEDVEIEASPYEVMPVVSTPFFPMNNPPPHERGEREREREREGAGKPSAKGMHSLFYVHFSPTLCF